MLIDGNTKVIGFFGDSYRKSKLYAVYNSLFPALKLNYIFVPFAVTDLSTAVLGARALGISAFGVTTPFKERMLEHIDEMSSEANKIGAVNVVVNRDGVLFGDNTDGIGATSALREKTSISDKKICLLGAGGAARSIAFNLEKEGGRVSIINIDDDIALELANHVGGNAVAWRFENKNEALVEADIIINATTVGMAGGSSIGESLVPKKLLKVGMVVMDIVPTPRETVLLKDALSVGCEVVYGDRMLIWQAFHKFRIYTGAEADVSVMESAISAF